MLVKYQISEIFDKQIGVGMRARKSSSDKNSAKCGLVMYENLTENFLSHLGEIL